jgi:hypothetical protein
VDWNIQGRIAGLLVNNELERIKEVVVAKSEVFSGDFTELAEKNYEKKTSARIDGIRAVI